MYVYVCYVAKLVEFSHSDWLPRRGIQRGIATFEQQNSVKFNVEFPCQVMNFPIVSSSFIADNESLAHEASGHPRTRLKWRK